MSDKIEHFLREFADMTGKFIGKRVVVVAVDDALKPRSLDVKFDDGSVLRVELGGQWDPDGPELSIDRIEPTEGSA